MAAHTIMAGLGWDPGGISTSKFGSGCCSFTFLFPMMGIWWWTLKCG